MSKQYPGGIISKTAPTLNPALGNSAPGIWTMDQVAYAIQSGTWPPYDPYYKYVTLNLHGNGTNAAQNNTFLDSSTNNFTITRNGNTTQGTFTPYGSNWSNYFDGSSAYLSIANATPLQLSGNQFTIEGWFYLTVGSTDNNELVCQSTSSADSAVNYQIRVTAGNKLRFLAMTSGATAVYFDGTTTITTNTWHHFACVCDGSGAGAFLRSWVDGVYQGASSSFNAANINTNSAATQIGAWTYSSQYLSGYISNFRILKGTALYTGTSNITVPTAPLTAITNTSLLTCQSNRFIDNSSNAYTVTANGSPSIQRFSPFSPATAYSTSVIGGSGYFDGATDYLTASANVAFGFGTGDFTLECWIYPVSWVGLYDGFISTLNSVSAIGAHLSRDGVEVNGVATAWGVTLQLNTWTHLALTRSGTSLRLFVNGAITNTATNSANLGVLSAFAAGRRLEDVSNYYCNSYISNARIVKGTAVYTAAFTPNTAPLSAISGTSILLSATNAGILDNAEMNDLETVGNAQISTSVVKYGTGSISFNGTSDYLKCLMNQNLVFNTGDFTVEFWVYFNSTASTVHIVGDLADGTGTSAWAVLYNSSLTRLRFVVGANVDILGATWSPSTSTWYHVAITRSGTSVRGFVNGTQVGTTQTSSANITVNTGNLYVGASNDARIFLNGYLDDLRITKGYARYTTNFTPPTSQLQDQ
jgi:Concanavalin A-like lectin/glucanases superfamily